MNLHGARIVVTRPIGRGESLCRAIEIAGGTALHIPAMRIVTLADPAIPATRPDWMIFASVAAVEHGLAHVRSRLTPETRIAAIGDATANALRSAEVSVDTVPAQQESEGLLALPEFSEMQDRTVWIVRGRGGRELMPETLQARGARVETVEVYSRERAQAGLSSLLAAWKEREIDAMVVSSRAGLESLHAGLDEEGRDHLRETQLVLPTARMLKLALEFDIHPAPIIANGASDDAFMAALDRWWRERRQDSR